MDREELIVLLVLGGGALLLNHYWHKGSAMNEKVARVKLALKKFAGRDQLWDEALLKKTAKETYAAYCEALDGPDFNLQEVRHLLHPKATWEVKAGNKDRFSFSSVLVQMKGKVKISIIHARNSSVDDKDCFTACFDAVDFRILERQFYTRNHKHLLGTRTDLDHYKEFWTFQRSGNRWLLLCIHDAQNWEMFTEMRILDEKDKS